MYSYKEILCVCFFSSFKFNKKGNIIVISKKDKPQIIIVFI